MKIQDNEQTYKCVLTYFLWDVKEVIYRYEDRKGYNHIIFLRLTSLSKTRGLEEKISVIITVIKKKKVLHIKYCFGEYGEKIWDVLKTQFGRFFSQWLLS